MSRRQPVVAFDAPQIRHAASHASNPLRKRDWRWSRVLALSKSDASLASEEGLIAKAVEYHRILTSPDRAGVDDRLFSQYPELHQAYLIFERADAVRYMIEALVVAREDISRLAGKFNLTYEIVKMYEDMFFDVRSRLDMEMFITAELFGPAVMMGSPGKDCDIAWKRIGFALGSEVLYRWWGMTTMTEADRDRIDLLIFEQLQRSALHASTVRTVGAGNASKVIEEYDTIRRTRADVKDAGGVDGEMDEVRAIRESVYVRPPVRGSSENLLAGAQDMFRRLAGGPAPKPVVDAKPVE